MGKSLTETARSILMKEGAVPSISSSDNDPDRDTGSSNSNKATLRPKSKFAEADPKHNEAEDLGGATPTSTAKDNLGAKAAGGVSKDKSKSGIPSVGAEPAKKLSEEEEVDEEIEISEELEKFINEKIEEGLSEEEIAREIEENFELVEETEESTDDGEVIEEEEETTEKASIEVMSEEETREMVKEHVDALLEGEELSEEFRAKALTIFESAVQKSVKDQVAVLEEAYANALEEQIEAVKTNLEEKVDDYMNYVVEQWIQENEVAIESGLRTEITEDFINGFRQLCAEHSIDLPETDVPVVEELGKKVEDLEKKLSEEIEKNVSLKKTINESKRFEVLVDVCDGLTDTQAEKLKALSENVEFTDAESFGTKLKTLKESYFPTKTSTDKVLDNSETPSVGKGMISEQNLSGRMDRYVQTLGRQTPRQ